MKFYRCRQNLWQEYSNKNIGCVPHVTEADTKCPMKGGFNEPT
jgi:hypothetical protein